MFQRLLQPPHHSFLLFGPRATGKSTWLRQAFPEAQRIDLLDTSHYMMFSRQPGRFTEMVDALEPEAWVIVDGVQRIPVLLDHVHSIMTRDENKHKFILSGSSARKLKKIDADLLAGRVFHRSLFPLVTREIGPDPGVLRRLEFGSLPRVVNEPENAGEILKTGVVDYLQQEIQQDALVRDAGSFSRFLETAALMNGQVVNEARLSRDSGVARPTVQRYFDVLIDTLMIAWVRALQPGARIKETSHPRFYFFDCGVVRALTGRLGEVLDSAEKASLFETLVLHELRAADSYQNKRGRISYWRTPSGSEVDFIWSQGSRNVGFEVKSSTIWRPEWSRPLNELIEAGVLGTGFGIYMGKERQRYGDVEVLPFQDFATGLYAGGIF